MYKENARVSNAHPGTSYSDKCLTEKKNTKRKKTFSYFQILASQHSTWALWENPTVWGDRRIQV